MSRDSAASILLPAAVVDVFALEQETAATFSDLTEDWRFARVEINVEMASIDEAQAKYGEYASPALVIVETNTIDDSFIEQLESLAGSCTEGTEAVVIGPTNDVYLYRNLVAMGVSDYLVRPIDKEDMVGVIANVLLEQIGASESRLVAVMGSKGGVGATTMAETLAHLISEDLGQKTMYVDTAGGWSSSGVGLGYEPKGTLQEAIDAAKSGVEDNLDRLLQKIHDNLSVLATGSEPLLNDIIEDGAGFEAVLDMLMRTWPVVIVDLSGAKADIKSTALARAQEIVVVTTPLLPALRTARVLLNEIKNLRGSLDPVELIINMSGMVTSFEVSKNDIKSALGVEPSQYIPFDPKLFVGAEANSESIGAQKIGRKISEALMPLARRSADYHGGEDTDEGKTSTLITEGASLINKAMMLSKKEGD